MVWTSFNRPLKYYVISNVHAGYQPEDYGKAYILMGFTLAVMFAYLTVKVGSACRVVAGSLLHAFNTPSACIHQLCVSYL